MKNTLTFFVLLLLTLQGCATAPDTMVIVVSSPPIAEDLSDAEIKKILIGRSIRSYSGTCPCPYNQARNGSRCGKRSAYSKPGGAEPLCYESDVTDKMVERYRKNNN